MRKTHNAVRPHSQSRAERSGSQASALVAWVVVSSHKMAWSALSSCTDYLLPIILTTIVSKWLGDQLNEGLYHSAFVYLFLVVAERGAGRPTQVGRAWQHSAHTVDSMPALAISVHSLLLVPTHVLQIGTHNSPSRHPSLPTMLTI